MKYQHLLFILILVSACSGTKRVVKSTPNKTSETKDIIDDSVKKRTKIIDKVIPTIITETENIKGKIIEEPMIGSENNLEVFNHKEFSTLLKEYISENGDINYKGIKKDYKNLKNYISNLGQNIPDISWYKEDKLAYWINAYNALTIDLIIQNYPIKSIKDIKNPWDQRLWKFGKKWYNLSDIEHQILRKMDEPRIHFAIVCASYSCPKLQNKAFTASNLDAQLTKVTKEFLNDSEKNNISENNLELSKIFQWFAKDFKQNSSLIDFLNQFLDIKISENAKIKYKDYNWALNE
ncbi:MAG: DUF547 domain-containing protein [Flaviramulus sp.]|nr:DUF547 domain-containing protein [Flaviramulus sp.]